MHGAGAHAQKALMNTCVGVRECMIIHTGINASWFKTFVLHSWRISEYNVSENVSKTRRAGHTWVHIAFLLLASF